ncbi:hypothetical protein [Deinococcus sp. QL22]|uniref:hypothetical protein n=1 Tax=Deinococcus sp. QL22 TaxID=2939437 RepID=UPI0020175DAB|nr:hypothetical protein [Deinococcus sp. QL22]UQN07241.1 hypothetical protein M1R55_04865 [Deinococcus sp. QL22]
MNNCYVLGWSNALTEGDSDIDWVGHWLITPDGRLGRSADRVDWLGQAQALALADEETFVVMLGTWYKPVKRRPR